LYYLLAHGGIGRQEMEEEARDPGEVQDNPAENNESNQINKWGFAPGEDDTQDLNMEHKGTPPPSSPRVRLVEFWQCNTLGRDRSQTNVSEFLVCAKVTAFVGMLQRGPQQFA